MANNAIPTRRTQGALRPEDVREIRRLLPLGVPSVVLARSYGVSRQTICDIKHHRSWKSVT